MKPLLAATIEDLNQLDGRYPLLATPKLDGIRALIHKGKVVSRNLKPIPNRAVQKMFSTLPEGFDGELICGDPTSETCFRDTTSGCMSEDGVPDVVFYVFDYVDETEIFNDRRSSLQEFFRRYKNKNVKLVQQQRVKSAEEVKAYEEEMLAQGYEGIMLRIPTGIYKFGRSTMRELYLGKLKRFEDSEATILEVTELLHNHNAKEEDALGRAKRSSHKANKVAGGTMGSLHVKDLYSGVEFDIGAGFTAMDRAWFWTRKDKPSVLGKTIKYKYFPTGSKDKPRFPVFLGFREE